MKSTTESTLSKRSSTKTSHSTKLELLNLLEEKLYGKAREDFYTFVQVMAPEVLPEGDFIDGRHIRLLCHEAQRVVNGENLRLMVFISPGSMKSKIFSVLLPLFYFGLFPSRYILSCSHSVELAEKFSGEVRNIIESNETYRRIFPGTTINRERRAVGRWQTADKGEFLAAGAGKQIAGFRGHLGIIDDAVSEQTAYSKAEREKINDWFVPGFRSRILPAHKGGAVIVINTRWHLNDLSGFLLKMADENEEADQWKVIKIPALLDEDSAELLGLKAGESFWPEMWPMEELIKTKSTATPHVWNALYMQSPTPDEGTIFMKAWFQKWEEPKPPRCEFVIMSCDTAFKDNQRSDYSAVTVWGIFRKEDEVFDEKIMQYKKALTPNVILLYSVKGRWKFPDLCKIIDKLNTKWKPDLCLIEDKASGQSVIQELRKRGLPIMAYNPGITSKDLRAHAVTPHVQAGLVWLPLAKQWAQEFMDEVTSFPYSEHDDLTDSFTQMLQHMRNNFAIQHPDDFVDKEEPRKRKKTSYWALALN